MQVYFVLNAVSRVGEACTHPELGIQLRCAGMRRWIHKLSKLGTDPPNQTRYTFLNR